MSRNPNYDYYDEYDYEDRDSRGGFIKNKKRLNSKPKRKGHQSRSQKGEGEVWRDFLSSQEEQQEHTTTSYVPHYQKPALELKPAQTQTCVNLNGFIIDYSRILKVYTFTKEYKGAPSYALKISYTDKHTGNINTKIFWYSALAERDEIYKTILDFKKKCSNTNNNADTNVNNNKEVHN